MGTLREKYNDKPIFHFQQESMGTCNQSSKFYGIFKLPLTKQISYLKIQKILLSLLLPYSPILVKLKQYHTPHIVNKTKLKKIFL